MSFTIGSIFGFLKEPIKHNILKLHSTLLLRATQKNRIERIIKFVGILTATVSIDS